MNDADLQKLTDAELDKLACKYTCFPPHYDPTEAEEAALNLMYKTISQEQARRENLSKAVADKQAARKAKRLASGGTWFDK